MSTSWSDRVHDYLGISPEEEARWAGETVEGVEAKLKASPEALVSFRLSKNLLADLQSWADEGGISRSELIRDVLTAAKEQRQAKGPADARQQLDDAIASLQAVRASFG